jgi:hypothetical protein
MLIKGEGGSKDEKRAVSLLTRVRDVGSVQAALGRLHLEGRLVPYDIEKAVEKIRHGAVWSYETRLELLALLSAHPSIKTTYYEGMLYDMVEAAELGEPGALAALIQIKLSGHVQFGDKAGGCALVKRAAEQGLAEAAKYAAVCG